MATVTALGMIETIGLVSAIEAADAGLKAAQVRLLGTDYVRGGLVMVRFEGEVAAVYAAVDAGVLAAGRVGKVFGAHVIPRAAPEVFCMLASDPYIGPGRRYQGGCVGCGGCEGGRRKLKAAGQVGINAPDGLQELRGWRVTALRQYARGLEGFPLTPGALKSASKDAILSAIEHYFRHEGNELS